MADQNPPAQAQTGLTIPAETQQKFGPLIDFIKASESMNDEERQYWINILPIMTQEQIKSLEDILMNEKKQLAAIDAKYSQTTTGGAKPGRSTEEIDEERRAKRDVRTSEQQQHLDEEKKHEEDVLKQINNL